MNSLMSLAGSATTVQAERGFVRLMTHLYELYTCGESSSVSELEGHELAESALYVLGLSDDTVQQTIDLLSSRDVVAVWAARRHALESRIPQVMQTWQRVIATIPPIRSIALRDTLASIGRLSHVYDTFFAAHEIPCSIDYPLSTPVSEQLRGLDYVEAWLAQLLVEAQFLSRFDTADMVAYLQSWCPDYQGLLINLYDPIHEGWVNGKIAMAEA